MDQKTPRTRNREASKQALLAAARGEFARVGYDAATTRVIADKAGLNEQLISRYFQGKEGLLTAVFEELIDLQELESPYESQPLADSACAEIEQYFSLHHHRLLEIEVYLQIFLPRLILNPELNERFNPRLTDRIAPILAQRLAHFQRLGQIRPEVDLHELSLNIAGQSLVVSFLLRRLQVISEEQARAMLKNFASYLTHGVT